MFDEAFVRNQDDELNMRLRLAGGRIVLDPSIRVFYTPRSSLRRVFRQYFEYGLWKPAVMRKHRRPTSLRSLVPAVFVLSIPVLATVGVWVRSALVVLAAEIVLYLVSASVFGILATHRAKAPWRLLPRVVACFPTFHVAYGVGMLLGVVRRVGVTPPRPS
jgi:hypothetical protein